MNQHDIRLFDKDDPQTAPGIIKEIKKATTDAGDKYETFVVTHEPINLKAKLAVKKRLPTPKPYLHVDDDEEIIDEDYTDDDDNGIDL
jgi:hypothetical protein